MHLVLWASLFDIIIYLVGTVCRASAQGLHNFVACVTTPGRMHATLSLESCDDTLTCEDCEACRTIKVVNSVMLVVLSLSRCEVACRLQI